MKEISKIVPKSSHILVWRLETPTVVACLKIGTVCNPSQVMQRLKQSTLIPGSGLWTDFHFMYATPLKCCKD